MLECWEGQTEQSELRLAAILHKLRSSFAEDEPKRASLLDAANQAWRSFRDAECGVLTFESSSGSAFQVYWLACLVEQNARRLEDLERLAALP